VALGDALPGGLGDDRIGLQQFAQRRFQRGRIIGDLVQPARHVLQVGKPGRVGHDHRAPGRDRRVRGLRGAHQSVVGVPEHDRVGAAKPVVQLAPRPPVLAAERRLRGRGRLEDPAVALADRRDHLLARAAEAERPHDRRHVAHAERDHLLGGADAEPVRERHVEALRLELLGQPVVMPGDDCRAAEALEQLDESREVVERQLILHMQHVEAEIEDPLDVELVQAAAVPALHVEARHHVVLVRSHRALVVVARPQHDQLDVRVRLQRLDQPAGVFGDPALGVPAGQHADLHGIALTPRSAGGLRTAAS
jgi:hypothetical protein